MSSPLSASSTTGRAVDLTFGGAEREDRRITGIITLLIVLLVAWSIASAIWRRRTSLVSMRGYGVRADVERLHDVPRVRVSDLTMTGRDVARLTLAAVSADDGDASESSAVEIVVLVAISESESGFSLLREWLERQSVLGVVMPTRIIRLRSLDDLRPLTLRRVDV
jgi:hypothetical protein